MKKTILISTLVSNGAGSAQILDNSSVTVMSKADELEIQIRDQATTMFHDSNPHLEQCYHLLPGLQGTIVEDSCNEEDDSITCNFKCDGDENIEQDRLLGNNIIFGGYEIKCQCHQIIGGNRVSVPCAWSGIPSCPVRSPPAILPEYGEQCGELSDQHGEWKCEGKSCYLHCNHGYIASDTGTKMSPKCSCSKFGDCSWYKPAKCLRINPESGKCKAEQALIGEMGCTGYTNGELCELDCPTNYKSDQYGIRRCECDSSGACDWLGDRGRCEEDFSFPGLESISSSSLLSNQKCKKLPETEMGFWQCDPEQTCTLVCPPGYEANQVVEIDCLCSNGSCLYQNQNSPDRRFQVHDIELTSGFECFEVEDYEALPDVNHCTNLPTVRDGIWNCEHGTCNLRCSGDNGGHEERFVVDCLTDIDEIDWSQVNCNRKAIKELTRGHSMTNGV